MNSISRPLAATNFEETSSILKPNVITKTLAAFVLMWSSIGSADVTGLDSQEVLVCLRFDDYCTTVNMDVVSGLESILRKHGAKCLFAVIPFTKRASSLDEHVAEPLHGLAAKKLRDLVQDGIVILAQHGYLHQRGPQGRPEFRFGTYEEQLGKINRGKNVLESLAKRPVDIFVPPWNCVDYQTQRALQEVGFTLISTSVELADTWKWELMDIPSTCHWRQGKTAIKEALAHLDSKPLVVLSGHFTDFLDASGNIQHRSLRQLEQLLGWTRRRQDVAIVGMDDARDVCILQHQTWKAITRSRRASAMPSRVREWLSWPKWLPTNSTSSELEWMRFVGQGFWLCIALIPCLITCIVTRLIGWHLSSKVRGAVVLAATALGLSSLLDLGWAGYRMSLVASWGVACGLAVAAQSRFNREETVGDTTARRLP